MTIPEPLTANCEVAGCPKPSRLRDKANRKVCVEHWKAAQRADLFHEASKPPTKDEPQKEWD